MQAQNPRLPCKTSGPLPFCCAMAYSWAASRYLQRPILDCVFCWSGCSCMKSLSFSVRWLHGPMVREFGSVTGNVAKEGWGFFCNIITPSLILWLTEHDLWSFSWRTSWWCPILDKTNWFGDTLIGKLWHFWILVESWSNVWQFCSLMSWKSAVQSCIRCFSSLFGYFL